MGTHFIDDLADAGEQLRIRKGRLAHGDAVATELGSLPDQPASVSQCANWHRSVIGPHAAELVAGDQRRVGAEDGGTIRGENTGRAGTDNDDICHALTPDLGPSTVNRTRGTTEECPGRGVCRTSRFLLASDSARCGSAPASSQNSAAWSAKTSGCCATSSSSQAS